MEKWYPTSHKSKVDQSLRGAHKLVMGVKFISWLMLREKLKNGNDEHFHHWYSSTDTQKQAHYILNLQDNGQLRNDFRWNKEILLQIITSQCGRLTGS